MKMHSRQEFNSMLPDDDAITCIERVLTKLADDNEHNIYQEIVNGLIFRDLIETLVEAKNDIQLLEESLSNAQEY